MLTLYDAARCPYCARVRIALAEKGIEHETVEIDLSRPARLAVREESARQGAGDRGGHVRPARVGGDHGVPRGALPRAGAAAGRSRRARRSPGCASTASTMRSATRTTRSAGARTGLEERLDRCLSYLDQRVGGEFGLVEIAYLPWLIRLRDMLGVELPEGIARRLDELAERPSIAAELETVAAPRMKIALPARAAVRRADVGAAALASSTRSRRSSTRSARASTSGRSGCSQQLPGTVRRGRRLDGRLHRGGDRTARAGAARRARARRLPRRRRPAGARAAARGVDPHRARAGRRGPLGGGGQELLRARRARGDRRAGAPRSPPSRIPTGLSARSRRSATGPTRPRP